MVYWLWVPVAYVTGMWTMWTIFRFGMRIFKRDGGVIIRPEGERWQ